MLLGEPVPPLPPLQASDIATEVMYQVAKMQSRYWTSIDVQACMPIDGERLAFSCFLFPISNAFLATLQKSLPTPTSTRSPTYQASLSPDSARNPLLTSLASLDMIKAHRAHHLYNKYKMTCLPLALKDLQSKFPEQVMNTSVFRSCLGRRDRG